MCEILFVVKPVLLLIISVTSEVPSRSSRIKRCAFRSVTWTFSLAKKDAPAAKRPAAHRHGEIFCSKLWDAGNREKPKSTRAL